MKPKSRRNAGSRTALDRFIAGLYRSGLSVRPEGFRDWALRQLQTVIPFDAAMWGSGNLRDWRLQNVTLLGLPPDYPRALEDTRAINPMLPHLIKHPGIPVDMQSVCADEQFYKSDLYRRCFRRFGIRRILATGHADPRSGMISLLSLYRRSRRASFSPEEKALQQHAAFHLFEAASHAYFLHLNLTFAKERAAGGAAAVVGAGGEFHEVQPRFLDLLERYFPGRKRARLPFPVPPPGQTQTHGGLCVISQPLGDLSCVRLWPSGPLDRLTERERQIVYSVTQGLSFKQVALNLGVAPSTVANHLYRVYRKLGVNGRGQLADLLYPSG